MEEYKKKGIKCIKYLILCITCLLSLNLFSNASAIEVYVGSTNPSQITYLFRNDDGNETSQTINLQSGFTGNIYFNPNSLKYQTMKNLNIQLNNAKQFSKTQRFKFKYYAKVHYEDNYSDSLMSVFNCPDGTNGYRIYYCNVEQLSQSQVINEIRQYPDNSNPQYPYFYGTNTTNDIYYVIEIKGYFNSDSLTTKTIIEFGQPFFLIRNNGSSVLTPLVQINLYFTTIEVFQEEESATEQEQQKELEDRDNLETQSTETSTDASTSSQDLGTASTNLTGVISSFVGNLQNLNANNCTLPEITAYGFSLGQMNLCTFQPPNWVAGITNVVVSLITLGLAYHLFKRIMGIAKSLAGGK